MATEKFTFTTLTGSETAGWQSINTLISSIDAQLYAKGAGIADGGTVVGQLLRWNGTTWVPGTVSASSIDNNSVELGTKTTGDYVASVAAAGSGEVVVTGSGESAAVTVRLADNTALRGAATVATPPTYTAASTGTVGLIADARYVTDALSYATTGGVTLSGDVTGATNANSIADGAVTSAKILDGTIVAGDISSTYPGHQVVTTTERNALTGVVTGTMIYNSTVNQLQVWSGAVWLQVSTSVPGLVKMFPTSVSGSPAVSLVDGTIVFDGATPVIAPDFVQVDGVFDPAYSSYVLNIESINAMPNAWLFQFTAGGVATTSGYSSRRDGVGTGVTTYVPFIASGAAYGGAQTWTLYNMNRLSRRSFIQVGNESAISDFQRVGGTIPGTTVFDGFKISCATAGAEAKMRISVYAYN
jgi:hypothetical protein